MAVSRTHRTRFAILGYLTCWGPMSGYEIKKALEGSAAAFWAESYGQIYPILRRLDAEELVRPREGDKADGRGKRVFEVTRRGRDVLDAWLEEPAEPTIPRMELLLKLFFGKRLSIDALRNHIENQREQQQSALEEYQVTRQGLESSFLDSEDMPFWKITLRYGERSGQAEIDWCNETLEELSRVEKLREQQKVGAKRREGKGGNR